jgi:DNA-binding MltR family transcriptional regulator
MTLTTDQFDSFVEDLLGEKLARPIIIIGASKIDDLLFRIIEKYLLPARDSKEDELLKGDTPLSTFSSRIKITYRLGIIDENMFKLLEQVRKIRNLCAHSIEFDIKKSPARDHFNELKKMLVTRTSFNLTKSRFFSDSFNDTKELQCILVTICVILEAIHEKIIKTKGVKKTLRISTK